MPAAGLPRARWRAPFAIAAIALESATARAQAATDASPPVTAVHEEPAPSEPVAGYSPEDHFFLRSADGRYQLSLDLQTGFKFEPVLRDGAMQNRAAFTVLRPGFSGHLYRPWFKYRLAVELAHDPVYLLDAWFALAPWEALQVRIGQQKTPISRHESYNNAEILFPDFSVVAGYFSTGRDKGVTVEGAPFGGRLEYFAGIYSGSPLRQITVIDGNYVALARVTVSPLGRVGRTEYPYAVEARTPFRPSFSLQGYASKVALAPENFDASTFSFKVGTPNGAPTKQAAGGADVLVEGGRLVFFGEGFVRRTDPGADANGVDAPSYTSWGAWAQVGVLIYAKLIDAALRFEYLDPSISLSRDRFISGEVEASCYIDAPRLVLRARYAHADQASPADAGSVVLPVSTPGKYDVFTLQLNLAL
jgi:hypothetical protein